MSHKVIFHIDELFKWGLLLGNVRNLLNALADEEVDIEVLANSEAVKYYSKENDDKSRIEEIRILSQRGVRFCACNNALTAYHLEPCDLLEIVDIVPVGILELIQKQGAGYAYIKP